MKNKLSEVQITTVKPNNGLVGFASLVLNDSLYLSGIGIYTRPSGGYRLTYPTKNNLNVFHPINRSLAENIEQEVAAKFEEITIDISERT